MDEVDSNLVDKKRVGADTKSKKICIKAAFTLFKVGQDKLQSCDGSCCRFTHFVKKADVPTRVLEKQLREVKNKWLSEEQMAQLVTRMKKMAS